MLLTAVKKLVQTLRKVVRNIGEDRSFVYDLT